MPYPSPLHLVVGTPCAGGQVTGTYFSSILKLQEACQDQGIALTFLLPDGDEIVQRIRQEITASFLEIPGATHLLFVDSDIGFEPDQAFRLLKFDADMTAAAYPLKRLDWEKARAAARAGGEKLETAALHYVVERKEPPRVREGFAAAELVGTGFLLVKRRVFTALAERHPELRYSRGVKKGKERSWGYALFDCLIDGKDGPYLSEDYSFCRRWTQMGGEIWVDLESRLSHSGHWVFQGDFGDRIKREGK